MKKLTYLAMATAALSMAACSGNQAGYVITGTVEGAADGDTVYLQEPAGRSLTKLDTAVIANGSFTFKGVQDSAVNRYITCQVNGAPLMVDFFLENGTINVSLNKEESTVKGTASNDAYQEMKSQLNAIGKKANAIYEAMSNSTLTDEQKEAKQQEAMKLQDEYQNTIKASIEKNITLPVGVFLFKQTFYNNSIEENETLLSKLPANYQNDEMIVNIKKMIDTQKKTAIGTKFTDFAMKTPDGKDVKLSDYVGKGKVVLVDFWASWCGPCRREMPNLVDAYKKYKGKNFEIVGVSLDQSADSWKDAIKKLNITWPQMSDLKFWNCEGAKLYAVTGIPYTVLIDGEGTIIARGLYGEELLKKIGEVVK